MNLFLFCAVLLLPLCCVLLCLRKLSGLYPWEIGGSFPDLLVLPLVGAYLLLLVTAGWLARCTERWGPRGAREDGPRHSPSGRLSPRATPSST